MFSLDEVIVTLLLGVGLYFPISSGGVQSPLFMRIMIAVLFGLLFCLTWRHGARPGAVMSISLPIIIVMTACTISLSPFQFGWWIFASYSLLAFTLALNLRKVLPGRLVRASFIVANVVNIACGFAILFGNEWIGQLLSDFYSQFYPELVPSMIALHKPVLTFGTHSLAGFFWYLFFWLNWETYKSNRSTLALFFAISELILMLAVASFTSVAFAALALAQMGIELWKHNRKGFAAMAATVVLVLVLGGRLLENEMDSLQALPQLTGTILDSDKGGPLARYGQGGSVRETMDYLLQHPVSPIGFAIPISVYVIDSGPLEYLLRGSIALLLLIYFGLYRFLRYNVSVRGSALTFFFVIMAFETGFTALTYYRTLFLLPFSVIYLRQIRPSIAEFA